MRRLAEGGLVAPAAGPTDADSRRKYFVLIARGRKAAADEARWLDRLVRTARQRKLYPQRT